MKQKEKNDTTSRPYPSPPPLHRSLSLIHRLSLTTHRAAFRIGILQVLAAKVRILRSPLPLP